MVLLGGRTTSGTYPADAWILQPSLQWGTGGGVSGGVFAASAAYDPAIGALVVFGGLVGNGSEISDITLTWTSPTSGWVQQSPAASPPEMYFASMDYDTALGGLVVFGGLVNGEQLDGTWVYNDNTWTNQAPAASPPARSVAAMAFDPVSASLLLYGGNDNDDPAYGTDLSDTWVFRTPGTLAQTGADSDTVFIGTLVMVGPAGIEPATEGL